MHEERRARHEEYNNKIDQKKLSKSTSLSLLRSKSQLSEMMLEQFMGYQSKPELMK